MVSKKYLFLNNFLIKIKKKLLAVSATIDFVLLMHCIVG
jgi:hypothetical protein